TNEDNIDLNRNFVDFTAPLPENQEFNEFVHTLCPTEWTQSTIQAGESQIRSFIERKGKRAFQAVVFNGQHEHPTAIFYGGRAPSWSHYKIRHVIQKYLVGRRHVALIDYHTGLGPYGYGERLSMYAPQSR